MQYEIAYFKNNRLDEYEDFLKSFKVKQYSKDVFTSRTWWAPQNPFGGYIVFAHTDKEIVSRFVITQRCIRYREQLIDCYETGGACTLAQHQQKGLFTRLVKKAMELGFNSGPKLIYGTPNDRSGPGFKKLGFSFIDKQDNYLIWIYNTVNILFRKLSFRRVPIQNLPNLCSPETLHHEMKISELSVDKYIRETKEFMRMNYSNEEYLKRRLAVSNENNRRFFYGSGGHGQFFCTIRNYKLSFLNLLLLSEYFLDGNIDDTWTKVAYAKIIQKGFYKNTDGIYLKGLVDPLNSRFLYTFLRGSIVHRKLPICYAYTGLQKEQVDEMMSQLINIFQLTDCDIG